MSDSQYTPVFNRPVYGPVIGEHNAVTINISQSSSSRPPFEFKSIIGIPPPTDSRAIQQRANLVKSIYAKLNEPELNALVLTGIGGIGKSTLAALVYRYAETDQHSELFTSPPLWLSIDPSVTFADLIGTICQSLDQPLPPLSNLSHANQASALFDILVTAKSSRLIIMDQFENFLDWKTGVALPDFQEVGAWIDAVNGQLFCTGCRLLLTSRPRPKGSHEYPVICLHEYPINGLTTAEGTTLLREQDIHAPEAELQRAIDSCNGHALSLILLIALVHDYHLPLTSFLEDSTRWGDDIATHLLDTIFARLDNIQRDLLRAFSVYRTPVPLKVVQSQMEMVDPSKVFQALRVLLTQHLIQSAEEDQYQLHTIVSGYVKQHFVEDDAQANQHAVQKAQAQANKYRDRQRIIERVRTSWIKGIFERSLEGAAFIPLGLYERPDLIKNPWQPVLEEVERPARLLPTGTSITQVFDEAEGELLILGEPGSGKTTLLLQLARDLLDRASLDETHPMPVVLNLSTWAVKRQSLFEWLIEELSAKYQIPQKIGKSWIENGHVLPLIDGLDEVAAEYRAACVDAIKMYRQQQGQTPLVIVSRLEEYTTQTSRIVMQRAVIVQPMTLQQIEEYLEKADGQLEGFKIQLRDDPVFQGLAKNPSMLSILTRTFQGKPAQIGRSASSIEEWRRQLFTDYVQSTFERRGAETRYSPEQTKYWLNWLAKQMKQRGHTVFYLEHLQIDWLANSRRCEIYTSLAFGLLSFPIGAIVYGLEHGLLNGILIGLMNAIIAFFFVLLIETGFRIGNLFPSVKGKKSVRKAEERSEKQTKLGAFLPPLFWERVGFAFLSGLLNGLLVEFLVGPFYALINGLFLAAFLIVLGKFERTIQPAEKLIWTWASPRKNAVGSLLIGVGVGVFGGLFDAYPYFQQLNVFLATLYFWLSLGVALGIIIMLMRGFYQTEIDKKQRAIKPNQGIRNSLSNSLRLGLFSGAILGLVVFFFYSFVIHTVFRVGYLSHLPQNADIVYAVGDALAVAYLFWLINGGFACVQHFTLRFYLWRTRYTPWNYPRFLDYAVQCTLLRKVGGGYIFVHKLLLDYFADLDIEEGPNVLPTESRQSETVTSILIPALSDVPRLLPCGHEQSNLHARFCSVCGAPISLESSDRGKTDG